VVFKGYNTTEPAKPSDLKPLPPSYHQTPASNKRKLTKQEEEERERKKKKTEKKLEARAAKAKEQNAKQASWQKFAKKAEKKGVQIAGVAGTSIFKTPDNPLGKGAFFQSPLLCSINSSPCSWCDWKRQRNDRSNSHGQA